MNQAPVLYRHGDVLLAQVPALPAGAIPQPDLVLALGEATGHAHRIREAAAARLFRHAGQRYLQVLAPTATLVHEEHRAIVLPAGVYRVWQQREYSPEAIRWVVD